MSAVKNVNGDYTIQTTGAGTTVAINSTALIVPSYTDTAARDAAITSPKKGMIVIAATTFYGYTGAAWVALN
jgi:hypothetical protein